MTVLPLLALVGNIAHSIPHPLSSHSVIELATSFLYFSRLSDFGFEYMDSPAVYTRFSSHGTGRCLVLALSFCFFWIVSPLPVIA